MLGKCDEPEQELEASIEDIELQQYTAGNSAPTGVHQEGQSLTRETRRTSDRKVLKEWE